MKNQGTLDAIEAGKGVLEESSVTVCGPVTDDFRTYATTYIALVKLRPADIEAVKRCLQIAIETGWCFRLGIASRLT